MLVEKTMDRFNYNLPELEVRRLEMTTTMGVLAELVDMRN